MYGDRKRIETAGPDLNHMAAPTGFGAVQGNGIVWLGSMPGVVQRWTDTQVVAVVAATSVTGVVRVRRTRCGVTP